MITAGAFPFSNDIGSRKVTAPVVRRTRVGGRCFFADMWGVDNCLSGPTGARHYRGNTINNFKAIGLQSG